VGATTAITLKLCLHKIKKEFKSAFSEMDLIEKFRAAAEATDVKMEGGMEINKTYRILCADTTSHPIFGMKVTLILGLLGDSIAVCPLPLAYSMAFTTQDINDINSKRVTYRLIYRKRQDSEFFYFEIVK
jgi:hypothetical protein